MSWLLVSDSSSNLFHMDDLPEGVSYATVPLKIRSGEREFVDNAALDVTAMMEHLDNWKGPSGTACPSPEEWAEKFLLADNVIAITISSALSGSYNSACIGADMVREDHPEKNIHVVDSLSAASELVFTLKKALELIESGASFQEVVAGVEGYKSQTVLLFVLSSFDNLVKNGRMSRLTGFVAGKLGMRAVGRASEEGKIDMFGKTRGETKALAMVLEEMDRTGYNGNPVTIDHVNNEATAQLLAHGIHGRWPEAQVTIGHCGGLCSFYAQNHGLMIGYTV